MNPNNPNNPNHPNNPNNPIHRYFAHINQVTSQFENPVDLVNNIRNLGQFFDDEGSSSRVPQTRRSFNRNHREGAQRLWNDYFSEDPTYPADIFRRRYRMSKELFLRICDGISNFSADPLPEYFAFFRLGPDCTGHKGFNILQKCTSALRQMAYGAPADSLDEYLRMSRHTSYKCLDNFCKCIFHLYKDEYLRKPTQDDIHRLLAKHEEIHGFPGMLGSLDCMHWVWRNCPVAWQGQYSRGDHGHPTIMLEAVASHDLWIWHAYFGPAGSNNDINVLNQSDLFRELLEDRGPQVNFTVNGVQYNKGYYLADGIYPEWATIVKSFKHPLEEKNKKFKAFQESARKDVERAFGVLQGRWGILRNPARAYQISKITRVMYCCIILHNMITEDNGFNISALEEDYLADPQNIPAPNATWREVVQTRERMAREMRDRNVHHSLRNNLVEHIWSLPNNFRNQN